MDIEDGWGVLHGLLADQGLAVLGTEGDGQPYTSLVAIAAEAEGREIYFATPAATTKYRNLRANERVSLLIDNRGNTAADFHEAAAATAVGSARVAAEETAATARALLLRRHPYLEDFLAAPSSVLFAVRVERYLLVCRFQQVLALTP